LPVQQTPEALSAYYHTEIQKWRPLRQTPPAVASVKSPAVNETRTHTASTVAGQEVIFDRHARWRSADCSEGPPPVIQIDSPPRHGKVLTRPGAYTPTTSSDGDTHCLGRLMKGIFLVYQPDDGFVGTDSLSYTVDFGRRAIPFSFDIRVLPIQPVISESQAPARTALPPNAQTFAIIIASSPAVGAKCIAVPAGQVGAGAQLQMQDCSGGPNQTFFYNVTSSQLTIGNHCVDAWGGRGEPGDQLKIDTCHGGASQTWATELNGAYAPIIGVNGLCMDIVNGSRENGAALVLSACHGNTSQSFLVRAALAQH